MLSLELSFALVSVDVLHIAIYNVLEMALSSMLYIINDVIMCSSTIYFPVIYFLT